MHTTPAGIDIAKTVFEVALADTPGDVARYRDGNKTDRADAKAVLEAAHNSAIDPVPVKSREQQAIATLRRLRQG